MKLIDLPRKIPPSVYEETREEVRKKYATIPDVVDVIEYGTIPHLGISDMDFIVVIEPGAKIDLPSLRTYTKEQQYAMDHAHFVISTDALPRLRLLDPFLVHFTSLLKRTSYTLQTLDSLSTEELRAFAIEYPYVSWILPWLEFFARVECLQELPSRYFLESIKNLPHSFRELHRAKLIDQPIDPNAIVFQSLADKWFEISDNHRVTRVQEALEKNRKSTKIYLDILKNGLASKSKWRKTNHYKLSTTHYPQSITYNFGHEVYIFEENRTDIEIDFTRTHSPLTSQAYNHAVVYLPLILSAPLNRLLFETGPLPDFIRKHTSVSLAQIPVFTHPALEERTQLINQTLHDVRNVRGGKLLGQTYGLRIAARGGGGNMRAKLGGAYDRCIAKMGSSSLGRVFRQERLHITF